MVFCWPHSYAHASTLSGITSASHCRRVRMRCHLLEDLPAGPAFQSSFVGAARVLLHHVEQWKQDCSALACVYNVQESVVVIFHSSVKGTACLQKKPLTRTGCVFWCRLLGQKTNLLPREARSIKTRAPRWRLAHRLAETVENAGALRCCEMTRLSIVLGCWTAA